MTPTLVQGPHLLAQLQVARQLQGLVFHPPATVVGESARRDARITVPIKERQQRLGDKLVAVVTEQHRVVEQAVGECVVGVDDQFALADDAVVLVGDAHGRERVRLAVDDEHGFFITVVALEEAAVGSLVGVPDVADPRVAERAFAQQAEVRDELEARDEDAVAHAELEVLEVVVARALGLLHTDGAEHGGGGDAVGVQVVEVERDAAAQGEADDVGRVDVEFFEDREDVASVCAVGVVGHVLVRAAVAGQVGRDDTVAALGDHGDESVEV